MALKANAAQIQKLQVVYAQLAKREIGMDTSRDGRMQWASKLLGRPVTSFSDLKRGETIYLIDQAQAGLGVEYKPVKLPTTREQARRAGLDGRKDVDHEFKNAPQIVSDEEMLQIQSFVDRLGWNDVRFRAWLESARSPFAKRESKDIKTTADANQVRWAMVGMLKARKLWQKEDAA